MHTSYSPWCFTGLWRYTEAAGYASHSHETIFATPFKTAFLEQLLLGKARHKSKCKLIHTYKYCTPPWHFLLKFPYKARKLGGHDISCVLGVSILPRNYSDVWYILFFILSQIFFSPAGITKYYTDKRSVFKLLCAKKALDVINGCNILDHKSEKSKILLFRLSHIPILHILQLRYSTTNRCWMILTLMTSSINLLIALVEVSYSYIFRIPMVYIVRLTLCTKC